MLNFKTPEVSDREWAEKIIFNSDVLGCDASFVNNFLWRKKYNIKICGHDGFLFKLYGAQGEQCYAFPIGCKDPRPAIEAILLDAAERNIAPVIGGLSEGKKEYLEFAFPNKFTFTENRDSADYIYLQENLANLPGKKYQKKRNHISKFLRNHENISFEPITPENYSDALAVAKAWCASKGCTNDLGEEFCAITDAFENFEALSMSGGILYSDGKAIAMTAGSKINSNVFDVNFEKALDIDGAYTMINREFAKTLSDYTYINREEDMGIEGLRKAKLSYYPETVLVRYYAEYNG